jgi:3-deoxy-D-manno-octulosonic acid (KDO) 8-phosphate synthase
MIKAAAQTGRIVNIKKGQFMARKIWNQQPAKQVMPETTNCC